MYGTKHIYWHYLHCFWSKSILVWGVHCLTASIAIAVWYIDPQMPRKIKTFI
jgi:hypothetical protein